MTIIPHEGQASQAATPQALTPRDILGPGGTLAKLKPDFEDRPGQLQMSDHVYQAILNDESVNIEAGTGTGKSLAYLVAIACTGEPVLIATATTVLQDQLVQSDLPLLNELLAPYGRHLSYALLKGKEHYACLYEMSRIDDELRQEDIFTLADSVDQFRRLQTWVKAQEEDGELGDIDHTPFPLTDELAHKVTTDHEHCLGSACPFFERCFAERAKAKAKTATVLVVNHHLLLLDGLYHFLPPRHTVIVDEGHILEASATSVSGIDLTFWKWSRLAQRGTTLTSELTKLLAKLQPPSEMPDTPDALLRRIDLPDVNPLMACMEEAVSASANAVHDARYQFEIWLDALGARQKILVPETSPTMEDSTHTWADRASAVAKMLARRAALCDKLSVGNKDDEEEFSEPDPWSMMAARWQHYAESVCRLARDVRDILHPELELITYIARTQAKRPTAKVRGELLQVNDWLKTSLWAQRITITCSATLALHTPPQSLTMAFWKSRVGTDAPELIVDSPFNFWTQARLYSPADAQAFDPARRTGEDRHAYERRMASYQDKIAGEIVALLQASQGRALVLFTGKEMMRRTADIVRQQVSFTVLQQFEHHKAHLLNEFRQNVQSALFATRSFWQGVDVPGEALSLVIIDRLPFEVPDDPLYEARVTDVKQRYGDSAAWRLFIMPSMLTVLRQGVGRLIRRADDRGVIAILDGRLVTKGYGAQIPRSLPRMPQIHTIAEVQRFLTGGRGRD